MYYFTPSGSRDPPSMYGTGRHGASPASPSIYIISWRRAACASRPRCRGALQKAARCASVGVRGRAVRPRIWSGGG